MLKKKILLSFVTLTFGSSLILSNMVYATGNPAETHDSTSPTRRVEDMQYGQLNRDGSKMLLASNETCSECQKQVHEVNKAHQGHNKVYKDGRSYRKHHDHHHKVEHKEVKK